VLSKYRACGASTRKYGSAVGAQPISVADMPKAVAHLRIVATELLTMIFKSKLADGLLQVSAIRKLN